MFFTGAAPDSVWLDGDLELLRRSDAVLLTDNWEKSSGARAEVEEANRVGIPVFTSLAALVMWRDARARTGDYHDGSELDRSPRHRSFEEAVPAAPKEMVEKAVICVVARFDTGGIDEVLSPEDGDEYWFKTIN
jgi:hypothetical protein